MFSIRCKCRYSVGVYGSARRPRVVRPCVFGEAKEAEEDKGGDPGVSVAVWRLRGMTPNWVQRTRSAWKRTLLGQVIFVDLPLC
jgi:hypothetical protein